MKRKFIQDVGIVTDILTELLEDEFLASKVAERFTIYGLLETIADYIDDFNNPDMQRNEFEELIQTKLRMLAYG